MTTAAPKTILVPTDYSEAATAAMRQAVAIATAANAEVIVLHAESFSEGDDEERHSARERLKEYAETLIPARVNHLLDLVEHPPVRAIVDSAEVCDADLIVMGTNGRTSLARMVLGSVASGVIRSSARPVLTVTGESQEARPVTHILCGVDFSDDSRAALDQALMLAHLFRADLTVLHVVVPGSATEDYAANALDVWLPSPHETDLRISCAILRGHAAATILELARSGTYDFVVLGARGTLALTVCRQARCPVLTAHAVEVAEPDWEFTTA